MLLIDFQPAAAFRKKDFNRKVNRFPPLLPLHELQLTISLLYMLISLLVISSGEKKEKKNRKEKKMGYIAQPYQLLICLQLLFLY